MLFFIYGDDYYGNRRKNKEKKKRAKNVTRRIS